jgi:hypothetical protein
LITDECLSALVAVPIDDRAAAFGKTPHKGIIGEAELDLRADGRRI